MTVRTVKVIEAAGELAGRLATPGLERGGCVTAAGRGEPVDEVPAGLVALGQQDRTRPHSGERQCRCRDTWRSLVGRDSDQRHAHPDPGVSAMATSPAEP